MAGVLAPVATQVGLQLVLQPFGNTVGDVAWQAPIFTLECHTAPRATPTVSFTHRRLHPPPPRSTAVGVLYPAYASFKAVEVLRLRGDDSEASRWLTYWAVYGAFATAERLLDKLLPW
jgi:hypothetical protein